jgi:hypothetical protein
VTATVLPLLERYDDTPPRATARAESHGPLSLFVAKRGWPFYARPRLGLQDVVRREDVEAVLARQDELAVPRALEWVHETTPSLAGAAKDAGMSVTRCPLLVLRRLRAPQPAPATVRLLTSGDPELAAVRAAVHVGFEAGGTAAGAKSVAERDAAMAGNGSTKAVREAVATVFCSAESDAVARVYERIGSSASAPPASPSGTEPRLTRRAEPVPAAQPSMASIAL